MTAMTLPEYAKSLEKSDIRRPLIEAFAAKSDILEVIPFQSFNGAAFEGYRETDIGTAAFRGINEDASSSRGKIAPFQESSFPIDVNLDVDKAILLRHGMERRGREEAMQMKAQAKLWTDTFIDGDNASEPREFSGIKARCTAANGRLLHNSAASGGAALSLYNLDKSIKNTSEPTHIIAGLDMQPRFTQAARNTSVSGFVIHSWDDVGRPKMSYAGLPILWGYPMDKHGGILPFSEVASGGGSAVTTSLFVASFREGQLSGIQLKNMEATDLGLTEGGVYYRTNVSWDVGLVDEGNYCVTRLTSITDAAFTA